MYFLCMILMRNWNWTWPGHFETLSRSRSVAPEWSTIPLAVQRTTAVGLRYQITRSISAGCSRADDSICRRLTVGPCAGTFGHCPASLQRRSNAISNRIPLIPRWPAGPLTCVNDARPGRGTIGAEPARRCPSAKCITACARMGRCDANSLPAAMPCATMPLPANA